MSRAWVSPRLAPGLIPRARPPPHPGGDAQSPPVRLRILV